MAEMYTKFELDLERMIKSENGKISNAKLVTDEENLINALKERGYDCQLGDRLTGENYEGVHNAIALVTDMDDARGRVGDFFGLCANTSLIYKFIGVKIDNTGKIKEKGLAYFNA